MKRENEERSKNIQTMRENKERREKERERKKRRGERRDADVEGEAYQREIHSQDFRRRSELFLRWMKGSE